MFCTNCGAKIPEGSKFCSECGAPVAAPAAGAGNTSEKTTGGYASETSAKKDTSGRKSKAGKSGKKDQDEKLSGEKVTENIYLCPDGKYRWYFEFDMLRNPTILITVYKVMGLAALIVFGFMVLADLFDDWRFTAMDPDETKIVVYLVLFFIVLILVSYMILAYMYGWKYIVLFEMNEEGIAHIQLPKQTKKANAIGWLTMMAGAAANNLTTAGIGMNVMNKNRATYTFSRARKVVAKKSRHVIYLNETLERGQIYAEDPDFDFVFDFISTRCTNAKIYT